MPGDVFLATPGHRESTRFIVGGIPPGGLAPDAKYWILSPSGVIGDLFGAAPQHESHLGEVTYIGSLHAADGCPLTIGQFAAQPAPGAVDCGSPVFLVLGTSAEVGKTTAAVAVLRSLHHQGHQNVIALKATGTSSVRELYHYRDFGADRSFDCIDFGLPTTYPSDREGVRGVFDQALDVCLSMPSDAVVIECGGDILGANVPLFLERLSRRRRDLKVVLAAPDALAALGAKQVLRDMGIPVHLITGRCTDTPTLLQRTQAVCETPAMNMARAIPSA